MLQQTLTRSPLASKTILVAVNISQWSARKLDRKVTKETNEKYRASQDAGRYNKLLVEAKRIAKINGLVSSARALHYAMTKPWMDEGPRILPNALYADFTEKFRKLVRDFDEAVGEFERDYSEMIEERKAKLGALFNPADYPPASEIRSKFNMELKFLPFPDAADWRSDIDPDFFDDVREKLAEENRKSLDEVMKHTAKQVLEVVGHMAERLSKYDEDDKAATAFRDSLVENVRELAKYLPAFNLTNDPKLSEITDRINKELCAEDAEALRKNANLRNDVAKSADEIVKAVEGLIA
jgi:hypothetical protein